MGRLPRCSIRAACCVALSLLAAGGCGRKTGTVHGKVTLNGKPVPGGYVNFLSEGDTSTTKSGAIQEDGSYSVSGVPVGPAKITVQGIFGSTQLPNMKGPKGMQMPRTDRKTVYVPTKYSNAGSSNLKCEVMDGSQEHNIQLTDP